MRECVELSSVCMLCAYHELPPGVGDVLARGSRKHAHQLLQGLEGARAAGELVPDVPNVDEVGGEGRVVVGEVPLP